MKTWYECTVKFNEVDQTGHERVKTHIVLVDAMSYSEAEARSYEIGKVVSRGDFEIKNIKKSNITSAYDLNDEFMFKAKIQFVSIDEAAGKEKKINEYILISGDDIDHASSNLSTELQVMLVPYTLASISISKIAEVFPYNIDEDTKKLNAEEKTEDENN